MTSASLRRAPGCGWRCTSAPASPPAAPPARRAPRRRRPAAGCAVLEGDAGGCARSRTRPVPSVLSPASVPSSCTIRYSRHGPSWRGAPAHDRGRRLSSLKGRVTFRPLPPAARNSRSAAANSPGGGVDARVIQRLAGLACEGRVDGRRQAVVHRVADDGVTVGSVRHAGPQGSCKKRVPSYSRFQYVSASRGRCYSLSQRAARLAK